MKRYALPTLTLLILAGCATASPTIPSMVPPGGIVHADNPLEPRLTNVRQLTAGGQNAEAYFSPDGTRLIFQSAMPGVTECDQQFTMTLDGQNLRMVSTGLGRTTCGYYLGEGERIVYSSTHHDSEACPTPPDRSQGYVWGLDPYHIYVAPAAGGRPELLFGSDAYDAEATVSPDGETIVFTSAMDGDLEIYTIRADGTGLRRLTHEVGYDGGPFFSPDGTKIVYRAHHPTDPTEIADYQRLLAQGLIRPALVDIWVMDADGSNKIRITDNGAANFAPFFHPSGDRIIFSSNMHDPQRRAFELFMVGLDGTGLERITVHGEFDGFPMWSPTDPGTLVFASNRGGSVRGETNVFLADWVEDLPPLQLAPACPLVHPDQVAGHIADYTGRYLADDALEGRLAGTQGAMCAAEFIAWTFRRLGLAPAGEDDSYFQDVPLASVVNPHAPGGTDRNVIGLLPGTDRNADGYLVIGAHFDHIGYGQFGSLAPGGIHNGADDNASGVAALLRVAETLAVGPRPRRPILFMAFAGEEMGLLGASHWTNHPTVRIEDVVAMINMDMVGRLAENGLVVYGTGTAAEWEDIVGEELRRLDLTATYIPDGYGASDQTAFYMRGIPVLHLFTNTHSDYHRPSDEWHRIDVDGIVTIADLVSGLARTVGSRDRMAVIPDVGRPPATAAGDQAAAPGYGAYLGTIPDFSPVDQGVLLGGVRDGSPADLAGLRGGDIIVGFGDLEIVDLYALTDALRAHRPGDTVRVEWLRDGERMSGEATLTRRQ
jgi:Tol biopolymer transport system component/S1-C subfamily serine protease